MELQGKVAIITGSAKGIGFEIARTFARQGACVVLVDRSGAEKAAESLKKQHYDAMPLTLDITDMEAVDSAVEAIAGARGRIDILVNNAGIIRRQDAIDFSEKNWDDVMNINAKTVFFFSQAAARRFIAQDSGGKIINIASMLSFQGGIRVPSYTASKSAVMGMTRLMANEWAKHGIHANAIAPGYMATNNTSALRADPERSEAILARIPAGRWGTPADIQGVAVFLASAASDYINGYTIAVDGGWLAR